MPQRTEWCEDVLRVEGLCAPRPQETHDARCGRVPAPFLLHVLPSGLVRIRQFGFLANRVRKSKLHLCRTLLAARLPAAHSDGETGEVTENAQPCPICKRVRLLLIDFIAVALINTS